MSILTRATRRYIPDDDLLRSRRREKPQILQNINWLGSTAETLCVSCEVRTGFFISQKAELFIVTAVKTTNRLGSVAANPMRYELRFHIPEDSILHSHRRENLKSYTALTGWAL
jgi:hypothetical protein